MRTSFEGRWDSGGARLPDGRHAFAAALAKSNEQRKGPIHVPSRERPSMYSGLQGRHEALQCVSTAVPYLGDGTSWGNGSARLSALLTQSPETSSTLLTELGRPGASPHQNPIGPNG